MSQTIRQKAEAIIKEKYRNNNFSDDADLQETLHELRVHQIELELQNQELLEAHQELRATRRKYFDLYNFAPVGYFTLDRKGVMIDLNLTGARLLKRERRHLKGKPLLSYFEPDSRLVFFEHLDTVFQTGTHQRCDLTLLAADKTITYAQVESILGRNEHDEAVCYMVMTDITHQKEVEEQLRLFEAAVIGSIDGISICDATQTNLPLIYISPGFERLTGYSAEECLGRNCQFVPWDERDQSEIERLQAALQKGEQCRSILRNYRKDGKLFWNDLINYPLYDSDGTLTHFVSIQRDITDQKRTEESLARHTQELQRSNAELEQFAYVASHDLQEPLRMVSSYVQLLERRYKGRLDTDADEFIHFAVDGAKRMQKLINDLLTLSRIGRKKQEYVPVDCNELVEHVLANLRVTIEQNEASVTFGTLPTILGDTTQLLQLFQNLISNAIKFRGEASPQIEISASKQGYEWLFSIKDNGIGIEPQHHERIFMIFQRLHSRAKYSGTGIGLALCKKIVEQHSGRIWLESEPNQGSTFYFTLPNSLPSSC